jgi:NAD+ synthase
MEHARQVASNLSISTEQVDLSPLLEEIGIYGHIPANFAGNRNQLEKGIKWFSRLTPGPLPFSEAIGFVYTSRKALWQQILHRWFGQYAGKAQAFVFTKVRLRMLMLHYYAALKDYLVIGTTDKSEYQIGFYDPHGDGVSDITLLRHLYKTQIRELARYLHVPDEIISKPSSGDLIAGLPNETVIGLTYERLDAALFGLEQGWEEARILERADISRKALKSIRQAVDIAKTRLEMPLHLA